MGVAQLVERWIVVPVAEGSNPSTHPKFPTSQIHSSPDDLLRCAEKCARRPVILTQIDRTTRPDLRLARLKGPWRHIGEGIIPFIIVAGRSAMRTMNLASLQVALSVAGLNAWIQSCAPSCTFCLHLVARVGPTFLWRPMSVSNRRSRSPARSTTLSIVLRPMTHRASKAWRIIWPSRTAGDPIRCERAVG